MNATAKDQGKEARQMRTRRCPHCGGGTVFWYGRRMHLCTRCRFMAYLTGDAATDARLPNALTKSPDERGHDETR